MQTCTVTKTVTSTVRQACCQRESCPRMTQRYSYRKTGTPEIHVDLHCHVTVTQKCPVKHTARTCYKDTGTINHALSQSYIIPEMRDPESVTGSHTDTPQTHMHYCKGRHILM